MRGDRDPLQRGLDAGQRLVRARWCPATSNVLAVLSAENVAFREEERRMTELLAEREGKEDPVALASHRAALAARRSSSLTIPSV